MPAAAMTRRPPAALLARLVVLTTLPLCAPAESDDADANLLPNPGFEAPAGTEGEMPDGWDFFCTADKPRIGITAADKYRGSQCARLAVREVKDAAQGIFVEMPVEEKSRFTYEAYVRSDPAAPLGGSAEGMLVIEWLDAGGREVGRAASKPLDRNLSRLRWTRVSLKRERVPDGARKARFGVHIADGNRDGKGAFLVDDVLLTE
ncbi:MAG: hypothetical protein JXB04_06395 [Kiritimatiellae bacterium]|nr:hypothetical protein [Kiritimatiellia bacterium]